MVSCVPLVFAIRISSPLAVQSLSNFPRCYWPRQSRRNLAIDLVSPPPCALGRVSSRADATQQGYKGLFAPLLSPAVWERKGNIPAVTRLLQVRGYKLGAPLESLE